QSSPQLPPSSSVRAGYRQLAPERQPQGAPFGSYQLALPGDKQNNTRGWGCPGRSAGCPHRGRRGRWRRFSFTAASARPILWGYCPSATSCGGLAEQVMSDRNRRRFFQVWAFLAVPAFAFFCGRLSAADERERAEEGQRERLKAMIRSAAEYTVYPF